MMVQEVLVAVGIWNLQEKIDVWIDCFIDEKFLELYVKYEYCVIKDWFFDELQKKLDEKVLLVVDYILKWSIDYFESEEGKDRFGNMIDDFLNVRGMFGSMVQMFFGNLSLVECVLFELLKFLCNEEMKKFLVDLFF